MKKIDMKITLIPVIVLIFISYVKTNAQSFGFGCLGLSGIYGGYSVQQYKADGLNNELEALGYYTQTGSVKNLFNEGSGFRVGANIVRAKFSGASLTVKGFYQFIREKETLKNYDSPDDIHKFELKMDYWGLGIDFGIPLFSIFDWKIIDGGVSFYKTRLSHDIKYANGPEVDLRYELPKTTVGYYAGTGLIIDVIPGYLSIEGTAVYNFIQIDYLKSKNDGSLLPSSQDQQFVNEGGFSGVVQLNLGVPL